MIKAKDAKAISRSAVLDQHILDQHILDQVNFAIIAEASKGNRRANITLIHKEMKPEKAYFDYFYSLGFKTSYLDNGLYIIW